MWSIGLHDNSRRFGTIKDVVLLPLVALKDRQQYGEVIMSEKHRLVGFSPPHGKGSKIDRWTIVRLLAALVLFGAAYFKLDELALARRPTAF